LDLPALNILKIKSRMPKVQQFLAGLQLVVVKMKASPDKVMTA